jgi:MFS transporter, SP family, arabinose:H+ symporter
MDNMNKFEKPNMSLLLMISLVASLGGLLFGFDIAIISGTVPFIKDYFDLNELMLGWGVSSLLIGCIIGAAFSGKMADKYGRRKMLIVTSLFFAVSCLATGLANNFVYFFLVRMVGGLAVGAASILSPMYISEISPSKYRGRMVVLYQLAIVTGILISYIINYLLHDIGPNNWRWMFASGTVPSVLFFILLFFVPRSPRWLYNKGMHELAYTILQKVGGTKNADYEIAEIKESLRQKTIGFKQLFNPRLRRVLFLGLFLAVFVQMTGINTVIDYAPAILAKVGLEVGDALFYTIGIGIVNFIFTWVAIIFIDKIGRRKLYLIGSAGMAISMVLLSYAFSKPDINGILVLVLMFLFLSFFTGCIGPVFWTLISEIFPNRARGVGMSVVVLTNWTFNWLVVFLFPWMFDHFGGTIVYGFLAIMGLLQFLLTKKFVPETKGKTLEEIEMMWDEIALKKD